MTVPYDAVIYDGQGETWVYTRSKPLTYKRVRVAVATVVGTERAAARPARPPASRW